jgi:uncharacterized protein YdaU (DUF1376 family)
MPRPWMPMYWGNYLADTRHLSRAQHGAYLLLIAHYWTTGSLPDDDRQLANITGSTLDEFQVDKPVLQRFFYDGWKHKRIDRELKRHMEIYAKRLAASEKGTMALAMKRFRHRQ